MNGELRFVDASDDAHFAAMSRIHALGWHATYQGAVPADYLTGVITDDHWTPIFRENYETKRCHGLLLYRGDTPVCCGNYGPAQIRQNEGPVLPGEYEGWGEILSFYTHPEETGKGYGSLLMEELLRRLKGDGFREAYVLVLRENQGARRFYARHGFTWNGTHVDIPFPPDAVCVDLRYVRGL